MAKVVRNVTSILAKVDLDGLADALILDADADTSISSPTDDQIDFEVGGTDRLILENALDKFRTANAGVRGLTVTTDSTVGNRTYTIAEMLGGLILRDPNGGARSDVTPTAAAMVAGVSGVANDDTFVCYLVNTANAAETVTLTAGTDVTLIPATVAMDQNQMLMLIVRFVDVSATEAVTIYAMVAGGT
jgi:hypothetical protein